MDNFVDDISASIFFFHKQPMYQQSKKKGTDNFHFSIIIINVAEDINYIRINKYLEALRVF